MIQKSLRPTTIIPPALYVERAADRQLDYIVDDMGRPGYVLVARQMGKTNLLINMKRKYEAQGALVPYFDLSSRHETLRSLFRSIIDQLIEDDHVSTEASERILRERTSLNLEPNAEYDRHLRSLLRTQKERKLIIILDEVDSLVSTGYSDSFFAQVRSMYFSRVNHSVYNNLTYVLSGVAEPTDLIKDKTISPFNIGEKIYLDDFSREEVQTLINLSQTDFANDVVDEVYKWTSGNPRMTWDVLSDLEDRALSGSMVTKGDVLPSVEKLYLTRFDRAPVDHIRVLAEADPQIRSAIASLRWGKGHTLDDKSKSRLYLAGVTSASTGASPIIKNRIIDAALSDVWLKQVSSAQKSIQDMASDYFATGHYEAAISHFEEYVRSLPPGSDLRSSERWQLGRSRYSTSDYLGAIADLEKAAETSTSDEIVLDCKHYIGSALISVGRAEESIPYLLEVSSRKGALQISSKVTLQAAYLIAKVGSAYDSILLLADEIIAACERDKDLDENTHAEVKSSALFNAAQACVEQKEIVLANHYIDKCLEVAPIAYRPTVLAFRMRTYTDVAQAGHTAVQAAHAIMEHRLTLESVIPLSLGLSDTALATTLSKLLESGHLEDFEKLLTYIVVHIHANAKRPFDVLLHLANTGGDERARFAPLVWRAVERLNDDIVTPEHRFAALRFLARYEPGVRKEAAFDLYRDELRIRTLRGEQIEIDDALTISQVTRAYQRWGRPERAFALLDLATEFSEAGGFKKLSRLIVLNSRMSVMHQVLNQKETARLADEILAETTSDNMRFEPGYEEFELVAKSIRDNALRAKKPPTTVDPFRTLGRNARVTVSDAKTGTTREVKFKMVEAQLRSGQLSLVKPHIDGIN